MSVLSISAVVQSTDHDAAVQRYELLLGTTPRREFTIPGRGLTVTVFPGISIISGAPGALAPIQALRATVFVDSLPETKARLTRTGWTTEGSLGSGTSLLARDLDGTLAEFVENTPAS
jgi:hypothetical protein